MGMKVLDLFAGIGGFSLGLERAGFETVAFCEIEDYPRKVLAKHWLGIPIARDVTKLTYKDGVLYDDGEEIYRGTVDVITGGFPCQDISVAGKQEGIKEGTRSGLWSECARLLREVQPKYAIFENVTALLSGDSGGWFQRVLWDISKVGYDAEWHCIPASELGAHHHRDRVWIICYSNSHGYPGMRIKENAARDSKRKKKKVEQSEGAGKRENVAHTTSLRQSRPWKYEQRVSKKTLEDWKADYFVDASKGETWSWLSEPRVARVAHGIPNQSHRIKCLGNAVVPQIPELIGRAIMENENELV